jgi:hypothetical protein
MPEQKLESPEIAWSSIDRVAFVRRSECVANSLGEPHAPIQSDTSRAHWRVVIRTTTQLNGAPIAGAGPIRRDTYPSLLISQALNGQQDQAGDALKAYLADGRGARSKTVAQLQTQQLSLARNPGC